MKNIFEIEDHVELVSSSYEASGHFSGDTGYVKDTRSGEYGNDIRVEWDNGSEPCWCDAQDFVDY